MSRKHNVRKDHSPSQYKARLEARGLRRSVMKPLTTLCTDKTHNHASHVGAGR